MDNKTIVVPTLRTERLFLEPLSMGHSAGMYALWSNPDVCRYSGPLSDYDGNSISSPVRSSAESDKMIDFWIRVCEAGEGFRWAIALLDSGEFIGTAGFNSLSECSEYAYHLHPDHWGKGLMSEASDEAFRWVFGRNGCAAVDAFINPENAPSIKLVERFGFTATETYVSGHRRYLMISKGRPQS